MVKLLSGKARAEVSPVIYLKLLETKPGRTSTVPHTLRYETVVNPLTGHSARKCTERPCKLRVHDSDCSTQMHTVPYDKSHDEFIAGYLVSNRFCDCVCVSVLRKHCTYPFCFTRSMFFRESHKSNVCQSPGSLWVIWWCTNWCKEQVKKDACAPPVWKRQDAI